MMKKESLITRALRAIGVGGHGARASGYGSYGASSLRKFAAGWHPAGRSADEDIAYNLNTLRARSRDLFMGSPLATGALKTLRTNIVGTGLKANVQCDREMLGLTQEEADAWNKHTAAEWRLWACSSSADAARTCTFAQMQALVLLSCLLSGDCFVALPYLNRPGTPYRLAMNLIEGDRVCNPMGQGWDFNSNTLEGVEVDDYGAPVAYWIARYNPRAAMQYVKGQPQHWERIPAFGPSGRRQVLHILSDLERPAQRRGTPFLAPVIESLKQLEKYTDSELVAAVVAGYFSVFIKSNTPEDGMPSFGAPLGDEASATPDPQDIALSPGMIASLEPGEDISVANPGRPNSNFEGFVSAICRQIGSALELPYELVIKQFSSSYSASRGALLEAWKMFRMRRQWLQDSFCQPVYEAWLAEAVTSGRVEAPGFFEDPLIARAWSGVLWSGDAQGQLDPQKEAAAAQLRVAAGFSTREREARELTNMDFGQICEQQGRELRMMQASGLETGTATQSPETPPEGYASDKDDDSDDKDNGEPDSNEQ